MLVTVDGIVVVLGIIGWLGRTSPRGFQRRWYGASMWLLKLSISFSINSLTAALSWGPILAAGSSVLPYVRWVICSFSFPY